jgi:membrane protease YdiL (CAAX protease family)
VTALAVLARRFEVPYRSALIPALWGTGAILPLKGADLDLLSLGLTRSQLKVSLGYFLLSSTVVFPLFLVGFTLFRRWGFTFPVTSIVNGESFKYWIIYNFFPVALLEELFFRGYLQGLFERIARAKVSNHLARFWLPALGSAFLFAAAHVILYFDPLRFGIFFSGLLFGWLRAKTGTLLAPMLSHGTANVVAMFLIRSVP